MGIPETEKNPVLIIPEGLNPYVTLSLCTKQNKKTHTPLKNSLILYVKSIGMGHSGGMGGAGDEFSYSNLPQKGGYIKQPLFKTEHLMHTLTTHIPAWTCTCMQMHMYLSPPANTDSMTA